MAGSAPPPLIEMATALISARARPVIRRSVRSAVLCILAGGFLVVGFTAATAALAIILSSHFGPIGAAMLIALGAMAAAFALICATLLMNNRERRRERNALSAQVSAAALARVLLPSLLTPQALAAIAGLGALAWLRSGTTSGQDAP